jgi:hypothetical protein
MGCFSDEARLPRWSSVTRRSIRQLSWYPAVAGPRNCHDARRVRRSFCHPGTCFIGHYECRGTKLISETKLSRCNKCYKMGTGAASRHNFDRSQKTVKVYLILIACRCALCPPKRSEGGCPGAGTITKLS